MHPAATSSGYRAPWHQGTARHGLQHHIANTHQNTLDTFQSTAEDSKRSARMQAELGRRRQLTEASANVGGGNEKDGGRGERRV